MKMSTCVLLLLMADATFVAGLDCDGTFGEQTAVALPMAAATAAELFMAAAYWRNNYDQLIKI